MNDIEDPAPLGRPLESPPGSKESQQHIRGSSVLLLGRLLALLINLGTQVLVVRYLAKREYGALAYGLTAVALGSTVAAMGLDKALARFLPIYHEEKDFQKLFGSLALAVGTISLVGLLIVFGVFGFRSWLATAIVHEQLSLSLLLILIFLVPLTALDSLLTSVAATFAGAGTIFFRRYLLAPILQIAAVSALVALGGSVTLIAYGYLAARLLGLAIYAFTLTGILGRRGLLVHFDWRALKPPVREIFGFTIPTLLPDLVFILTSSFVVLVLEHLRSTAEVAAVRAVMPVAGMNMIVFQNFAILFTPLAARAFARNDHAATSHLFWRSSTWITLITLPVLLVTVSLSEPVTVLLFGDRYRDSALPLTILAIGFYLNATLAFNGLMLRVYGRTKFLALGSASVAAVGIAATFVLIRAFGAVGAAISTSGTMILQGIVNQVGLALGANVRVVDRTFLRVNAIVFAIAAGTFTVQHFLHPPLVLSVLVLILATYASVRLNQSSIGLAETFPEIVRLPLIGRILGGVSSERPLS